MDDWKIGDILYFAIFSSESGIWLKCFLFFLLVAQLKQLVESLMSWSTDNELPTILITEEVAEEVFYQAMIPNINLVPAPQMGFLCSVSLWIEYFGGLWLLPDKTNIY